MVKYKLISEWRQAWQLPRPVHPLINVIKVDFVVKMHVGDKFASFCKLPAFCKSERTA
ncbi:hypothetical protein SAMN05216436_10379 [bacterium A37T11]|nr:hypothetical protein SAMN05216436_10379 [bacterium A37T11]